MNYQKIYDNIINSAKLNNRKKLKPDNIDYIYYENHHIIPKCMAGTNDNDNLVLLTAREHYICHKLLIYIYPNHKGMILSFFRLSHDKRNRKQSSRDYVNAKNNFIKIMSGKPSWSKDKKFSAEHKKHISESRILNQSSCGENNGMYGKQHTKESIEKMSKNHIGKKHTDEAKAKISISSSGENNPMYNLSVFDLWIKKYGKEEAELRKTKMIKNREIYNANRELKICPHCQTTGKGAGIIRYHFDNCRFKQKELI